MARTSEGSNFQVKLTGIKLPAAVEKRIATEIRATVMRELAQVDLKGDLRVGPRIRLGPETIGFIARLIPRTTRGGM